MEKNVQVAVRVRPMNEREKALQRPSVVTAQPKAHQITVRKKTYTFDRVFGQYATQKEVFKGAVQNAADEALSGFNCTVFAYGQTGTGKTHTIQGSLSPNHENAGIIPRSVNYIFEKLQATKREYSVRVSFLQLYNEECKDLLSETKKDKPLRLMEDIKRGGVYCQNLEEITTLTASHVYELLETGAKNRMTAETLLNDQSSRSHCIFTIRIHSKEANVAGEDILRSGTLNLVDLAGSECIGRSGARNARAREAGNINQSLLTLGRVITALVDKHPHVPYRDSKLTRLLQESLGGKAMTTIIATVGPGGDCVDETLSTLDYAHRAKSIKNKPEANQRMTKHVLIKEYSQEIDALRAQLIAARNKDGIYLPTSQFTEMQERITGLATQLGELEDELERKSQQILELEDALESVKQECQDVAGKLQQTETRLILANDKMEVKEAALKATERQLCVTEDMLHESRANETHLLNQAHVASKVYSDRVEDIRQLHRKLERKQTVLSLNTAMTSGFADTAVAHCADFEASMNTYREQHQMHLIDIQSTLDAATATFASDMAKVQTSVHAIQTTIQDAVEHLIQGLDTHRMALGDQNNATNDAIWSEYSAWVGHVNQLKPLVEKQTRNVEQVMHSLDLATKQMMADASVQLAHMSTSIEEATAAQVGQVEAIKESVARAVHEHSVVATTEKDQSAST
ncbi:hypothetical protein H310_09448 [Aphanomyces invadans]|uniref:Kinesin-like protein n=1 Tax=Aphanomyces invadans TaxID=157072 RepID=A0A024TU71_9STRA|nr:hypothetical protein H310_09448 [Aphanomyces invadans]ETV97534.1 hypothetical protein H310_09448 [Aphanomyces invadans]|eukprot:XP_008873743.1 hypothetical protein H310_09448 [Aphanomyces invadans]